MNHNYSFDSKSMPAVLAAVLFCLSFGASAVGQISVGGKIFTGGGTGGELTISSAAGEVSGLAVGESEFSEFVMKLKSLEIGSDTADQVVERMGTALHTAKNDDESVWKYNYLIADDQTVAEYSESNRAIAALDQSNMEWSKKAFKKLDILKERQKLTDRFTTQAECRLTFGGDGKLSAVQVQKIRGGSTEVLYSKGASEAVETPVSENAGLVPSEHAPPESPKPGQIYFNLSDKSFYGWDGSEWVVLNGRS